MEVYKDKRGRKGGNVGKEMEGKRVDCRMLAGA